MIQKFKFTHLDLPDAYLIKPFISTDDRGAFIKDYSKEAFEKNNIAYDIAEVFYTCLLYTSWQLYTVRNYLTFVRIENGFILTLYLFFYLITPL